MTPDQIINVVVIVALVELMVAIGLAVTLADVVAVATNRRLVLQSALANYVCVPAAAVVLLVLLRVDPMAAAGILITAVCPGAPYGPPFTAMAKGNVAVAVGLMVVLAGSSAIVAPLLLQGLLPVVSSSDSLHVNAAQMVVTLLVIQLLPLCVGLVIRQWRPRLAIKLLKPANVLSVVLNVLVIGLILLVHFHALMTIRPRGFAGMLTLVLAALAMGWLLGMPGRGIRTATAMTTSVRNVGVGLVIATNSFSGTAAVSATVAFGLFQTIAAALIALGWGRLAPATHADPARQTT